VSYLRKFDISVLPWILLLVVLAWGILGFVVS